MSFRRKFGREARRGPSLRILSLTRPRELGRASEGEALESWSLTRLRSGGVPGRKRFRLGEVSPFLVLAAHRTARGGKSLGPRVLGGAT